MTDTLTIERKAQPMGHAWKDDRAQPDMARINANIRAELARHGRTALDAKTALGMGQTAWRARMAQAGNWRASELITLASWLDVELDVLTDGVSA